MNVMVIDDDKECLDSLYSALRLNGFSVQTFNDPNPALAAYNPATTDVVISDYHLPGMSGIDILEAVRKKKADVPVVIMSGDLKRDIVNRAMKAGAFAFLPKPLNIENVISILKKISRSTISP
jgi:DNA-binding NtrC family response regulator